MAAAQASTKTAVAKAAAGAGVGIDEVFSTAMRLHQEGRLDAAREAYERILRAVPAHAGASNALGMLCHQRGDSVQAVALIERAITLAPEDAGFHNNLGNVHLENERLEAAVACYRRALALAPEWPMALNNLGHALKLTGELDAARRSLLQAVRIDPTFVRAYTNLGLVCAAEDKLEAAIECYRRALELDSKLADVRVLLGRAYYKLGRPDDAAGVYRSWLELDPGNPVAAHMFAAASGQEVPARAGDAYVERTFDDFAASFDAMLTGRLEYRAPQLCAEQVARWVGAPAAQLEVLDAGCGTGLCGPLLKPWALRLHGVDLSRGMLDRAHLTGAYDALYKAELTQFLQASPGQWELLVSADTLCYFGDLAELFAAASASLKPQAAFVFTVEALPDDDLRDFALAPHGRYAHHLPYLRRLLPESGFELLAADAATLRQEGGRPVPGWVVAARRGAAPAPH